MSVFSSPSVKSNSSSPGLAPFGYSFGYKSPSPEPQLITLPPPYDTHDITEVTSFLPRIPELGPIAPQRNESPTRVRALPPAPTPRIHALPPAPTPRRIHTLSPAPTPGRVSTPGVTTRRQALSQYILYSHEYGPLRPLTSHLLGILKQWHERMGKVVPPCAFGGTFEPKLASKVFDENGEEMELFGFSIQSPACYKILVVRDASGVEWIVGASSKVGRSTPLHAWTGVGGFLPGIKGIRMWHSNISRLSFSAPIYASFDIYFKRFPRQGYFTYDAVESTFQNTGSSLRPERNPRARGYLSVILYNQVHGPARPLAPHITGALEEWHKRKGMYIAPPTSVPDTDIYSPSLTSEVFDNEGKQLELAGYSILHPTQYNVIVLRDENGNEKLVSPVRSRNTTNMIPLHGWTDTVGKVEPEPCAFRVFGNNQPILFPGGLNNSPRVTRNNPQPATAESSRPTRTASQYIEYKREFGPETPLAPNLMKQLEDWHRKKGPKTIPPCAFGGHLQPKLAMKIFDRNGVQLEAVIYTILVPCSYRVFVLRNKNGDDKIVGTRNKRLGTHTPLFAWLGDERFEQDISAIRMFKRKLENIVFSPVQYEKFRQDSISDLPHYNQHSSPSSVSKFRKVVHGRDGILSERSPLEKASGAKRPFHDSVAEQRKEYKQDKNTNGEDVEDRDEHAEEEREEEEGAEVDEEDEEDEDEEEEGQDEDEEVVPVQQGSNKKRRISDEQSGAPAQPQHTEPPGNTEPPPPQRTEPLSPQHTEPPQHSEPPRHTETKQEEEMKIVFKLLSKTNSTFRAPLKGVSDSKELFSKARRFFRVFDESAKVAMLSCQLPTESGDQYLFEGGEMEFEMLVDDAKKILRKTKSDEPLNVIVKCVD